MCLNKPFCLTPASHNSQWGGEVLWGSYPLRAEGHGEEEEGGTSVSVALPSYSNYLSLSIVSILGGRISFSGDRAGQDILILLQPHGVGTLAINKSVS